MVKMEPRWKMLSACFLIFVLIVPTTRTINSDKIFLPYASTADHCPPPCLCTWITEEVRGKVKERSREKNKRAEKEMESYDVDCSLQGLTRVIVMDTRIIETSLVRLNLHSNHISILKRQYFAAYTDVNSTTGSVASTKVTGNGSSDGTEQSLQHQATTARGLSHLNLANNGMLHMEVGCFDHLHGLISLILSQNHLSHLDPDIFSHLHYLQHLDLSSNYLYDAENSHFSFYPLFNLQRLDLSFNNFHSLPLGPGFERCSKLSVIDFSGSVDFVKVNSQSFNFFQIFTVFS